MNDNIFGTFRPGVVRSIGSLMEERKSMALGPYLRKKKVCTSGLPIIIGSFLEF